METSLTLFFTHRLRGDLSWLPRLHTFLRKLQADIPGKALLVDLGESCAPEVWPCGVTGGRSTLLVMDAMGYTAANVTGVLTAPDRSKLEAQVALALVDETHPCERRGIRFATSQGNYDGLQVVLAPGENAAFIEGALILPGLPAGQVGAATLPGEGLRMALHTVPSHTPPDSTIAGVVDLVIEEARYYEGQNPGG